MAVDPTGAGLKQYLAEDPGGPVVMLNLLRFRPDGGRERYAEYVEHFRRTAAPHGAEVVYAGDGGTPLVGGSWDAVLLVRYPSREAFSRMVADPEYQQFTGIRSRSLDAAVLQATVPWG